MICYFQRSEFILNFEYFAKPNEIFSPYFCDRFSKLKRFFAFLDQLFFYIFGRFAKTKCRTSLRISKEVFLKFRKNQRRTPKPESFLIKFQASVTVSQMFSCGFCKKFQSNFFIEHFQ